MEIKVFSNPVDRQLTLPRAVCLAGSARVAPEDVAGVAAANQAFTIITIMLIIVSIILLSQSIITFKYCPRGCGQGCSCTSSFYNDYNNAHHYQHHIVVTIIEINHYIPILPQRMWPGLQLHIKLLQ